MTIAEAAVIVLKEAGRPMRAQEIYEDISRRRLYKFNAQDPVAVVSQALRKKSVGYPRLTNAIFIKTTANAFTLANVSD